MNSKKIEPSITKELRKNLLLKMLEDGPKSFTELQKEYGKGPSSLNRLLIELVDNEKKIDLVIYQKKRAYALTKKGEKSILSFGIIGMQINQILEKGGMYYEDYSNQRGSMYFNNLPWGIEDDLVLNKSLAKINPVKKDTVLKLHELLYQSLKDEIKKKRLDRTKDGQMILGFTIDYKDLIKSIEEESLEYSKFMSERELDLLEKWDKEGLKKEEKEEFDRLRQQTRVKLRRKNK